MYYNQELGLCIEFGPVRVDSVRGGGPPLDQIPPAPVHAGLLPGLLVIACYLSFTPSSLKSMVVGRLKLRKIEPDLYVLEVHDTSKRPEMQPFRWARLLAPAKRWSLECTKMGRGSMKLYQHSPSQDQYEVSPLDL